MDDAVQAAHSPRDAPTAPPFDVAATANAAMTRWTFAEALGPVTVDAFRRLYWARAPLRVARGAPDFYGKLASVEDIESALRVDGVFARGLATTPFLSTEGAAPDPVGLTQIFERMAGGAPLRVRKLETLLPPNAPSVALLRDIEDALGHPKESLSCYLAPSEGRGLGPHHDETEIITLQISGAKRWRLYHQVAAEEAALYEPGELGDPAHDVTLQAGDLLYVPAGMIHDVIAGPPSFSLTLVFEPLRWREMLDLLVDGLRRDPAFLETMPARGRDGADPEGAFDAGVAARKAAVARALDALTPAALARRLTARLAQSAPQGPQGGLRAALDRAPFGLDDAAAPVAGLSVALEDKDDCVTLLLPGGHRIRFPSVVAHALRAALAAQAPFRARDLPGPAPLAMRVGLMRRLLDAGVLRRGGA